jgi:hypothetical protein
MVRQKPGSKIGSKVLKKYSKRKARNKIESLRLGGIYEIFQSTNMNLGLIKSVSAHLMIVLFLLNSIACVSTTVNEEMLPDGNTWKIAVSPGGFPAPCKMTTSVEECIQVAKPTIEQRAREICNGTPNRIFSCLKTVLGGFYAVTCSIKCKEANEVKVLKDEEPPVTPPSQKDETVFKKAKKCQAKGGIWVNDKCQIEVE